MSTCVQTNVEHPLQRRGQMIPRPNTNSLKGIAPDAEDLPKRVDRRTGAALVNKHFFPVSSRTIEAWPIPTKLVNGKATMATADLFAYAQEKLDAAPEIMGGRKKTVG